MIKTHLRELILLLLLLPSTVNIFAQPTTRYVSPGGSNTAPYTSWATAATDIQTAVNYASAGDLILVGDGLFTISSPIVIAKGITLRSQNGKSSSIINGNNVTLNIVLNDINAVVDGFTITKGYNPGGFGGGANIVNGGTIQNCLIFNNQARDGGGVAIDNNGIVQNCSIFGNRADNNSGDGYGGGVRMLSGGITRNCAVYGNTSAFYGGGINIWEAGTIQNCTILNNSAFNGGGVRLRNAAVMENSICYFNGAYNWQTEGSGYSFSNNCTTPALPSGTGNIVSDPVFVDHSNGNYHLTAASPCVNTGVNQSWMTTATDLDGNSRIASGTVDMGAYEYSTPAPTLTTIPVNSWPVGNATIYSLQPTLFWYITGASTGLTYEVQCVKASDPWPADNVYYTASGLNYTITANLEPGTQYAWRVRASLDALNKSPWSAYTLFKTSGSSGGPIVPTNSWPTDNALVYTYRPFLIWYVNGIGTGLTYEVQCVKASDPWPADNVFVSVSDLSYTLTYDLDPGTQYAWRVRSVLDPTHKSAWSSYSLFTTMGSGSALLAPTILWPTGNTKSYTLLPTLVWFVNGINTGLSYEVQCVKASDPWPADNVFMSSTDMNLTLTTNLEPGTQYAWRVRSVLDPSHKSAWSAYALFTTNGNNGGPVIPIGSWPLGNTTVYTLAPTLYWYLLGISTGLTYEVQCVKASDPWPADNVYVSVSDMSYTPAADLVSGTQYAWRVRSVLDATHKSGWSTYALFTTFANSYPVAPVAASPVGGVKIVNSSAMLSWYLPTAGSNQKYDLQYSNTADMKNPVEVKDISVSNLQLNSLNQGEYYWRVKSITADGKNSAYSGIGLFSIDGKILAVKNNDVIPAAFRLEQNYPNPFNPSTVINFSIPEASFVSLKLYDILGREIRTLLNNNKTAGVYSVQWDGRDNSGNVVQSGTYFYRLVSGGKNSIVKKLIFMK